MDWSCCLSSRAPALQLWSPEFKFHSHIHTPKKKKKKKKTSLHPFKVNHLLSEETEVLMTSFLLGIRYGYIYSDFFPTFFQEELLNGYNSHVRCYYWGTAPVHPIAVQAAQHTFPVWYLACVRLKCSLFLPTLWSWHTTYTCPRGSPLSPLVQLFSWCSPHTQTLLWNDLIQAYFMLSSLALLSVKHSDQWAEFLLIILLKEYYLRDSYFSRC
jgi:hypothetical protein